MQHTTISLGEMRIGNHEPFILMAGPCLLESREIALSIAQELHRITEKLGIGFIFKASFDKANRTGIHSPRGLGLEQSLDVFIEIKKRFGCPVMTDVHAPEQCARVADVVDVLQIPALLCRQTDLVVAAASTGCVLNIKKGQFLSPPEMHQVARKATEAGNNRVLLCERGSSFGYNLLVNDMRGLAIMAESGHPVIFDATHSVQRPGGLGDRSGGESCYVEALARAAVGIGIAGIFMETHHEPKNALCDGPNMVPLNFVEGLLETLQCIDRVTKKRAYQGFSLPSFYPKLMENKKCS